MADQLYHYMVGGQKRPLVRNNWSCSFEESLWEWSHGSYTFFLAEWNLQGKIQVTQLPNQGESPHDWLGVSVCNFLPQPKIMHVLCIEILPVMGGIQLWYTSRGKIRGFPVFSIFVLAVCHDILSHLIVWHIVHQWPMIYRSYWWCLVGIWEFCCLQEGDSVNVDVTAPGATLALGLMFFNTSNTWVTWAFSLLLCSSLFNRFNSIQCCGRMVGCTWYPDSVGFCAARLPHAEGLLLFILLNFHAPLLLIY